VPASGFALEASALASLLRAQAPERQIATLVVAAPDSGSLTSAFLLASALRAEGLAVQVAGEPPRGSPVVKVAGKGYVLVEPLGGERRLPSVEAVAAALRESDRD
jgi:hypothetical protein